MSVSHSATSPSLTMAVRSSRRKISASCRHRGYSGRRTHPGSLRVENSREGATAPQPAPCNRSTLATVRA
jgi:hypothetical protein